MLTTRTGLTGSVNPLYEPAMLLGRAGVVPGHDLTSEAALTKLSYLLALPDSASEDVARQMSISIQGELTEQARTVFQHPNGLLSPQLVNLTALGYAITKGDLEEVRDILRGESRWLLNEADYSGNTPLVRISSIMQVKHPRRRYLLTTTVTAPRSNGTQPGDSAAFSSRRCLRAPAESDRSHAVIPGGQCRPGRAGAAVARFRRPSARAGNRDGETACEAGS